MSDNIVIFYHTCQLPLWEEMFAEQTSLLRHTGLLDAAEKVMIHINGNIIPNLHHDNIEYVFNPRPEKEETDTLCAVRDFAAQNDGYKILYFHMKGIKSQVTPAIPAHYIHGKQYVTNWRRMMENYVIKKWKLCVKLLDGYDSVGTNFAPYPRPHWSGGMWWATSEYIRKLDNNLLETESRYDREFWIGSGDASQVKEQRQYLLNGIFPMIDSGMQHPPPPAFAELHRSNVDHYGTNYPPENWGPVPEKFRHLDESI